MTADDLRKASAFILAFAADAWRGSPDREAEFTGIAGRLNAESKRKSAAQVMANMSAADEKSFWEARRELRAIRDYAHAWIGGPWAFLGSVLARAVTAVPHYVVLPAFAGPPAALNLFIGLVGEPNAGKGKASRAAAHILPGAEVHVVNLGSGEGIAHQYQEWRKNRGDDAGHLAWVRRAALFQVQEAALLRALSERSGSTLDGVMRSAWMGESLGFAYVDKLKRLDLPPLSYRLCVVAQITPSLGPVLLDGRNEGTPQRLSSCRSPTRPRHRRGTRRRRCAGTHRAAS